MTENYLYIDTAEGLKTLAQSLRGSPWLCLDTEFMREKTYYTQLCLVQVANAELVACIDPLAIDDLSPLLEVLYDSNTTKVLHAARQDLEILYHLRGDLPQPIFDTQIAAALLCRNDQIGYASLVEQILGVQLDKAHTRTDWSLRPLDAGQLQYAADDVRYLREVYLKQLDDLRQQGRLDWLQEDFAALAEPRQYQVDPGEVWRRVKDARRLKGQQLAVLQLLTAWREERAMDADKPRKWILRDEVLLELARRAPGTIEELTKTRGLEKNTINRHGEELLRTIQRGKAVPRESWPTLEPRVVLTEEQEALVDLLMAVVRLRASEQRLSPGMLATRKQLDRLVLGDQGAEVLHGWRGALVGHDLQTLLQGSLSLSVEHGLLKLRPC